MNVTTIVDLKIEIEAAFKADPEKLRAFIEAKLKDVPRITQATVAITSVFTLEDHTSEDHTIGWCTAKDPVVIVDDKKVVKGLVT